MGAELRYFEGYDGEDGATSLGSYPMFLLVQVRVRDRVRVRVRVRVRAGVRVRVGVRFRVGVRVRVRVS